MFFFRYYCSWHKQLVHPADGTSLCNYWEIFLIRIVYIKLFKDPVGSKVLDTQKSSSNKFHRTKQRHW